MGRTRTRRGKATRGVLGSQLREHLRERQTSSQSSEPGPRSPMLAQPGGATRLETLQLWRSPRRKTNTLSLDSALSYARHISHHGAPQTKPPSEGLISSGLGRRDFGSPW